MIPASLIIDLKLRRRTAKWGKKKKKRNKNAEKIKAQRPEAEQRQRQLYYAEMF